MDSRNTPAPPAYDATTTNGAPEPSGPPPSYDEVHAWWGGQDEQQKAAALAEYDKLTDAEKEKIRNKHQNYYPADYYTDEGYYPHGHLSFWDMYAISRTLPTLIELDIRLNMTAFHGLRTVGRMVIDGAAHAAPHIVHAAASAANALGNAAPTIAQTGVNAANAIGNAGGAAARAIGHGGASAARAIGHGGAAAARGIGNGAVAAAHGIGSIKCEGCCKVGPFIIPIAIFGAIIASAVALATSAFIAAGYAAKNAKKSITNLLKLRKVTSSGVRIAATAGGIALGAVKGAAIGAAIGSVVPGIGTAAGAVIGALWGAAVTAGLASFVSKKISQFIAKITNKNPNHSGSNTNPDKYKLSNPREMEIRNSVVFGGTGLDTTAMLSALRRQKNAGLNLVSIPCTNKAERDQAQRDEYNELLSKIKTYADVSQPIKVASGVSFQWSRNDDRWIRQAPEVQVAYRPY